MASNSENIFIYVGMLVFFQEVLELPLRTRACLSLLSDKISFAEGGRGAGRSYILATPGQGAVRSLGAVRYS